MPIGIILYMALLILDVIYILDTRLIDELLILRLM